VPQELGLKRGRGRINPAGTPQQRQEQYTPTPLRLCSPALLSCRHAIVHGAKDAKLCETPGGRDIRADELKGLVHNPKTGTVQ